MEKLIKLLSDGNARSLTELALELNTDVKDVRRKIEYLERIGVIRKVSFSLCESGKCAECTAHSGDGPCKGCMPEGGFKNMGEMWEVR